MVDTAGLSQEQFDDFAAGLGFAIKTLKQERTAADNSLLSTKAANYEEYLQKFYKVQAYNGIIADLESMRSTRKESI